MNLYRSDWIGIILGIGLGAYQPFGILNNPMLSAFNSEALLQFIMIGLIAPSILALLTKFTVKAKSSIGEKIGKYINLFFMMIAFGVTTGFVGFAYHLIIGLPAPALMSITFFGAGGFGFIGAYLIYPDLAYRSNHHTQ